MADNDNEPELDAQLREAVRRRKQQIMSAESWLETAARSAAELRPGKWEVDEDSYCVRAIESGEPSMPVADTFSQKYIAEYIAAASPTVVLELIRRVRELEEWKDAREAEMYEDMERD